MRSSLMLAFYLLLLILFHAIVQNNIFQVVAGDEGEASALGDLKHAFNNTILNREWEGQICYSDGTSSSWFGIDCTNGRVSAISLPSLGLSGSIESNHVLSYLTELTVLNLTNNSIHGIIMNFTMNGKLRTIDLSRNKFEGPIPSSLLILESLMSLHLEENHLTGEVLDFNQVSLADFNVSYNNLSGTIPTAAVLQNFDASSFMGNPNLCGPPLISPCEKKKNSFTLFSGSFLIVVFILFVVIAVGLIATFCFINKRRRNLEKRERKKRGHVEPEEGKNKNEDVVDKGESVETEVLTSKEMPKLTFFKNGDHGVLEFELDELLRASADSLGKGNFGSCYKAKLNGSPAVVVKRLKDVSPLTSEEFAKHMKILADLTHPNLLPFIAYYYSNAEKLLLHKVAPHSNLFYRLHVGRGTSERLPLKWPVRLSIAKGIVRAMAYLHLNAGNNNNSTITNIPHGNLKPSNVLLDDKDTALVTDHAFSSIVSPTIASQRMAAYKSPEYLHRRKVSPKSDVWCFGSLLLEILTGRVSTVSNATNGVDLGGWVYRAVREEWTAEIFDVEIAARKRASGGMLDLLKVALRCCEKQPEKRPEMVEVARAVEEIVGDGVEETMSDESWSSFGTAEDEFASISDH